jgi:hypothetical protein
MIFKFVPLRLGVDEAGTGKVSELLRFTQPAGVTLAIVRKARDLFWSFIGVGLLIHRQVSLRKLSPINPGKPLATPPNISIPERERDLMMMDGN